MRVSVRKDDPGFNLNIAFNCTIMVDGVDVTNRCYTADEELGMAMCFKHNHLGNRFVDPDEDKVAEEILEGKVVIVIMEKNGVLFR